MPLQAPFPYHGGKRRWASEIWERLGDPDVYAEPFAGSLAVLLARPQPCRREVVCDLDGNIVNFWRAIRAEPEAVAFHADYPTYHHDLTARHRWIQQTRAERAEALMSDPDWYDAKAAGWWAWGASNWIGGGFGTGTCLTRQDKIPAIMTDIGGRGINAQRSAMDQRLLMMDGGGQGVQAHRIQIEGDIGSGDRLNPWFRALARRLAKVFVLARSWESGVTRAVLGDYDDARNIAVFLDPPYVTDERSSVLYESDYEGKSTDTAAAAYAWAVEHGDRYRIAYAMHEGDFPVPAGWSARTQSFGNGREGAVDQVIFSPACDEVGQQRLF